MHGEIINGFIIFFKDEFILIQIIVYVSVCVCVILFLLEFFCVFFFAFLFNYLSIIRKVQLNVLNSSQLFVKMVLQLILFHISNLVLCVCVFSFVKIIKTVFFVINMFYFFIYYFSLVQNKFSLMIFIWCVCVCVYGFCPLFLYNLFSFFRSLLKSIIIYFIYLFCFQKKENT